LKERKGTFEEKIGRKRLGGKDWGHILKGKDWGHILNNKYCHISFLFVSLPHTENLLKSKIEAK